ncbi:MAG: M3 family oligoendopeptidase [Bacteroidota bacterium]
MKELLEIGDHKAKRTFIPYDFVINNWEDLKPHYEFLIAQEPDSVSSLEAFLRQINELDSVVAEDFAWRHIKMTCDTQDVALRESYQTFVQEIMPQLSMYEDKLNRKIVENPYFQQLDPQQYRTYTRQLEREINLFRKENVALKAKDQSVAQQYGAISGKMTIEHEGQEITLQQAGKFMEARDRGLRQEIWEKTARRRLDDAQQIQTIFDELLEIRHQTAQNAGYDSFTRYKFDQMGRFDYTLGDTHAFHDAVEKVVRPVYERLMEERKNKLGLDKIRPWDLSVDIFGEAPLKPFEEAKDLLHKSINVLGGLKPELGEMIALMNQMGYLDLDSRVGKAPGGYNYPLMEVGVPFIFMNAAGSQTDVITMLHESGHAVHSFLTRNIRLNALKRTPSEVAELAAMSMELLCLDGYEKFYQDSEELTRAKKNQLQRCIVVFPWIASVDAFQQWIYDHPGHSQEERNAAWTRLYYRFHGHTVDWSGYEEMLASMWLRQGHIFDVPFYYIEYAIAQLGALAVWRNFKQQPDQGLQQYLDALALGYTRTIPEIYEAAGIRFDFSADYVAQSVDFCLDAYQAL